MTLHDVLVALTVLVGVLAVLGWRRGRRLHALFDSVRDLRLDPITGYRPGRLEDVPFGDRALTQTDGGVTVTVAVLSPRESRALFGTDLARSGIQPVWVQVKNEETVRAVLVFERRPVSLDEVEVFEWERPGSAPSAPPPASVRLASGT